MATKMCVCGGGLKICDLSDVTASAVLIRTSKEGCSKMYKTTSYLHCFFLFVCLFFLFVFVFNGLDGYKAAKIWE